MKQSDFSNLVRDMSAIMPETSRTELAFRLIGLIESTLNESELFDWYEAGMMWFLHECQLKTWARPAADWRLEVGETPLAAFCAKWLSVSEFKLEDESDDAMRPVTAEMHGLRQTMINELRQLGEVPA